jgi:hypothetical protein
VGCRLAFVLTNHALDLAECTSKKIVVRASVRASVNLVRLGEFASVATEEWPRHNRADDDGRLRRRRRLARCKTGERR